MRKSICGVLVTSLVVLGSLVLSASPASAGADYLDISPSYREQINDSAFIWTVSGYDATSAAATFTFGDGGYVVYGSSKDFVEVPFHAFAYPCSTRTWGQTLSYNGSQGNSSAKTIKTNPYC